MTELPAAVPAQSHLSKILKFVIGGGIGATLDLSSQWVSVELLAVPAHLAFVLSASLGALTVFVFNKFITFKSHESVGSQFLKFVIVYVPAIGLNFILSSFFYWLGASHEIAKVLAIGIGAVLNYVLSNWFIFKKKKMEEAIVV